MEKKAAPVEANDSDYEEDEFGEGTKKDAAKEMKKKDYGPEEHQDYDETLKALFEKVPPGEGDEFAAVKPWLGAIKEPKSHPKANKKEPSDKLVMDWVYGYRSEEARMNAAFNAEGAAVYPAAAVGVIFDYKKMAQSYFGGGKTDFSGRKQDDETGVGHSDDVTALCVSFSRKLVASGQNGQQPLIFLWDSATAEKKCKKRLPKGCRLVTAIGISATDQFIAASDAAEKIAVHLFKIAGGEKPIATVQINQKIVHLAMNNHTDESFATAGKDHVAFCVWDGKTLSKKVGKCDSQCSISFSAGPDTKDVAFSASNTGQICQWTGGAVGKTYDNCKGSVGAVVCRIDKAAGGEVVLAGGNDKSLICYKFEGGALTKMWSVQTDSPARSIDLFNGQILLGLKNGSLCEMAFSATGSNKPNVVMTSHCDGEVWGLDVVTISKGEYRFLTSCDDNRILAYNPTTKQALAEGEVNPLPSKPKKEKAGFKGGASSMSNLPASNQSRALVYSPELKHLAVADNKGIVTIRDIDWNAVDARTPGSLDAVKKTLQKELKKTAWIECMVYSPGSKYLVIGSHDDQIYLYDTKTYKKPTKLSGHSSFITAIDWAIDSSYIRSVCGAYELLFFNIQTKKRDPSGASNTVGTVWADQTCKLGWNVQGIFPPGCDGSHINSCAMTKDQTMIASGDDYGLVCTYNNPCLDKHASGKYRGHSEHVTRVRFSDDSKYIMSTGGQDQVTIQWLKKSKK